VTLSFYTVIVVVIVFAVAVSVSVSLALADGVAIALAIALAIANSIAVAVAVAVVVVIAVVVVVAVVGVVGGDWCGVLAVIVTSLLPRSDRAAPGCAMRLGLSGPLLESSNGKRQYFSRERSR
jgi:hypothetical protein